MTLKELLGDKYTEELTLAEAEKVLAGKNLVDLSSGNYVAKEKYDRVATDLKEKTNAYDEIVAKTKDYDELVNYKNENETAKANDALNGKLKEAGFKDEFLEYAKYLIKDGKIANDENIVENAKAFLKDNKQYGVEETNPNAGEGNPQPSISTHLGDGQNGSSASDMPKIATHHPWNVK